MADSLSYHQLSYYLYPGRLTRHSFIIDIIRRDLAAARVPALRNPRGLDYGDGRQPDDSPITPFSSGWSLDWDTTCTNTFASTHVTAYTVTPESAAQAAEQRKLARYSALVQRYLWDAASQRRTGEKHETSWHRQRVSLAICRDSTAPSR